MTIDTAIGALRVGGALHFVQLPAMLALALAIQRRGLRQHVPGPLARVLGVLAGGIVLVVASGGVLSWLLPAAWLGTPFGAFYAISWCVFWTYRLGVQIFLYRVLVAAEDAWAHRVLAGIFMAKAGCYAIAAAAALAESRGPS